MLKKAPCKNDEDWSLPWEHIVTDDMFFQAVDISEEPLMRMGEFAVATPIPLVRANEGDILVVRVKGGYSLRRVVPITKDCEPDRDLLRCELPGAAVVAVVSHFCRDVKWVGSGSAKAIASRLLEQTLKPKK